MATYQGSRSHGLTIVTTDGEDLPLRLDLRCHSPTGFEWGYPGSGPAQLALALLAHHFGQREDQAVADQQALALYQAFKARLVATLPAAGWTLDACVIEDTVELIVAEHARSSFEQWSRAEALNLALQQELTTAYDRLAELERERS
jgi:hypothetical protein